MVYIRKQKIFGTEYLNWVMNLLSKSSQSQELNPRENLWVELKEIVHGKNSVGKSEWSICYFLCAYYFLTPANKFAQFKGQYLFT